MFTTPKGERIIHKLYRHHYWVPAVRTAQANGLQKNPRIHDLRHTHASWLIQDGVPLFTISRRLAHTSTRTTEQVYGHLMPEALQAGADATALDFWVRSLTGNRRNAGEDPGGAPQTDRDACRAPIYPNVHIAFDPILAKEKHREQSVRFPRKDELYVRDLVGRWQGGP